MNQWLGNLAWQERKVAAIAEHMMEETASFLVGRSMVFCGGDEIDGDHKCCGRVITVLTKRNAFAPSFVRAAGSPAVLEV